MDFFIQSAHAQGAQQGDSTSFIIMMVLMFAAFYFLLIRPQQKKQKEQGDKGKVIIQTISNHKTIIMLRNDLQVNNKVDLFQERINQIIVIAITVQKMYKSLTQINN